MSRYSLRWIRKLFLNPSYKEVNIAELHYGYKHKNIQLNQNHLLVDCEVFPKRKLMKYGHSSWDSSSLVETYGLEKNFRTETNIHFYNSNPDFMRGGLSVSNMHIFVSCDGEIYGVYEAHPVYQEMLPKFELHYWQGVTIRKSDWSNLLEDLYNSKITLSFPAIIDFEKDKHSKVAGCGRLRIYSYIPELNSLMYVLAERRLI